MKVECTVIMTLTLAEVHRIEAALSLYLEDLHKKGFDIEPVESLLNDISYAGVGDKEP